MTAFVPGQIDPNVKIPDAIKATAARADAAFKAAYNPEDADGVQKTDEEAPAASAENENAPQDEGKTKKSAEENTEQPPVKGEEDQSWEHRYK